MGRGVCSKCGVDASVRLDGRMRPHIGPNGYCHGAPPTDLPNYVPEDQRVNCIDSPTDQHGYECVLCGHRLSEPAAARTPQVAVPESQGEGGASPLMPLPGAAAISKDEAIGIICGLADMQAGRVTSLSAIDAKAGAGTEQTDPDDLTLSPGDPRYLSPEAQIARLDHLIAYVQAHAPDAQVEAWLGARRDTVREQIAPADPLVTKTP